MPSAPTDSVEYARQQACVRINDAIASIGGDVLTDTQPFTIVVINNAWRRLQEVLFDMGWNPLNREIVFSGVPATAQTDPGSTVSINWSNYFNGGSLGAPLLPADLLMPLDLEERITAVAGFEAPTSFSPMDQCFNGLPRVPKGPLNRQWQWMGQTGAEEALFLPGATMKTDILLRYAGFLPDFVPNSTTAFTAQEIPLVRGANALAWYMCSELSTARGDADAKYFDDMGQGAAVLIFNRDTRQGKTIYKRSEYSKMTDKFTPPEGAQSPRGSAGGPA